VTYRERQRLADIQAAIDAIRSHLQRGDLSSDGLVFYAVRIRLLEIGEAVKALPAELLSSQPAIPWTAGPVQLRLQIRRLDLAPGQAQGPLVDLH
jgi:uncharacterized protein with HEPN domain